MHDDNLWGLIILPIGLYLYWLRLKDWSTAVQRPQPIDDSVGILVCIVILAGSFWATVFDHPEARIGWFAGLVVGGLVGLFDLSRTRARVERGRVIFYSSRLVAVLLYVAWTLWDANHDDRGLNLETASASPASMFFATALLTYSILFINGLYSIRRFDDVSPPRRTPKPPDRIEYGSRRRGRRP